MKHITTKQYSIMSDQPAIWDFMVDIYDRKWANGVAAPFYEYAITSSWMDTSYLFLNRIWLDGDTIVAFVFSESPLTDIYFSLRPGYEELAGAMCAYAEETLPNYDGKQQFVLFGGQSALREAARKRGYESVESSDDLLLDFEKVTLQHRLPDGYAFLNPKEFDPYKLALCCWKGFNHEQDEGAFTGWNERDPGTPWNPVRAMRGVLQTTLTPPPHSTQQYDLIIVDKLGEYVCYSGMWWVRQNRLAYMEPLCTVPEHRRKGLASAILSEHYRRMKPLGATHMTGGTIGFYRTLGYESGIRREVWKKKAPRKLP